jgi:hypothetical protein
VLHFLKPAAKSKSDHPATRKDAGATDTTATMDEDRLATEGVAVYEFDKVTIEVRC